MPRFEVRYVEYHHQNTGFVIHDTAISKDLEMPLVDFEWMYEPVCALLNQLHEQASTRLSAGANLGERQQ